MNARRISAVAATRLVAGLVLTAPIFPAAAQGPADAGGAVGLPSASTITGTIRRAPDGRIVLDPPRDGPPGSPTTSPAALRAGLPSGAAAALRSRSPAEAAKPTPVPIERPADGANDWDEVSCRSIAWENIDHQQCRGDLAAARARLPTGKHGATGGN